MIENICLWGSGESVSRKLYITEWSLHIIAAEPIIQGLHNTAVKHRGEVKLTCKVRDQTDTVKWRYFPVSQFICGASRLTDPEFYTLPQDDGLFQLVINDVRSEMTGIYQCSFHKKNITASAQLVTLCKYIYINALNDSMCSI